MDFDKLTEVMRKLSLEAGDIIMDIYNSDDFDVRSKSDDSPVTVADEAADAHISAGLRAAFPDVALVTEEQAESHSVTANTFLIVDPLDGTKEFIKRNGDFTVNIALIEGGKPILGVVFTPVANELFYSAPGQGAFEVLTDGGEPKPINAASFAMQDAHLRIVASASHLNQGTKDFMDQFDRPEIVQRGSSLKIMELARGNAHVYPRLAPTMEWDTGAAHAILLEAGGKMVDDGTGKEMRYNKENLLNPHFIGYGAVREELLAC